MPRCNSNSTIGVDRISIAFVIIVDSTNAVPLSSKYLIIDSEVGFGFQASRRFAYILNQDQRSITCYRLPHLDLRQLLK